MRYPFTAAKLLIVALPVFLWTQTPRSVSAQIADDDVIRASTKLVTIPVIVKTHQGAYIPNLQRESFRIYEDGVEQQISHFETVDQPFTVVLMLDMSDSTKPELQQIQNAAIAFLDQLRPDDRALIVAFDRGFANLSPITGDRKELSDGIRRVKSGGGTALYDALDAVINVDLRRIPGRKAIVLLTDGIDTASVHATFESTICFATQQYAQIDPIQWNTSNDALAKQLAQAASGATAVTYTTPSGEPLRKAYERGTRYLQQIAQTSGGHFHYADSLKNLERSFARIAEELRQQYSLGYYPKNQGPKRGNRRIKVSVSINDAVVHARESYSYKSDIP